MPSPPPFFENLIPRLSLGALDKELLGDDAEESLPLANTINELLTCETTSNDTRILISLMCALVKQNTYLYSKVCQVDQTQDDTSSTLTQLQLKVNDLADSQHQLHAQVANSLARRPQLEEPKRSNGKQPANPPPPPATVPPQSSSQKKNRQQPEGNLSNLSTLEAIDVHVNRRLLSFAEVAQMNKGHAEAPSNAPKKNKKPAAHSTPGSSIKAIPLPLTQRRAFSTRLSPEPVTDRAKIEAILPTEFGKVLADGGLTFPHTKVQATINTNGTVTCTTSSTTHISTIQPFFPRFIELLNAATKADENTYKEFKPVPTDVDYIVHAVPLFSFPSKDMVTPVMQQAILFACDVNITKARFLTKLENRGNKKTTSIVITIPHEDTSKIGDSIRIFGRPRRVAKVWHATPQSICQNCSRLGHAAAGCRAKAPTCPICAGPMQNATTDATTITAQKRATGSSLLNAAPPTAPNALTAMAYTQPTHATAPPAPLHKVLNKQSPLPLNPKTLS